MTPDDFLPDNPFEVEPPPGHLVIAVDVEGCDIVMMMLAYRDMADLLQQVDANIVMSRAERMTKLGQSVLRNVVRMCVIDGWKRQVAPQQMSNAGALSLWLACNHPASGEKVRDTIANAAIQGIGGVASICLMSDGRFACAIGPAFADLAPVCDAADAMGIDHTEIDLGPGTGPKDPPPSVH